MQPLEALKSADLWNVRGLLTDIDDTLTSDGRLTATAYVAMERMYESGLKIIPITGRPAGWCDHIARMWPVTGVVGENGAFYFYFDRRRGKLVKRYLQEPDELNAHRRRLLDIRDDILSRVPGAGIASDQDYRIADLAVDFCEDVSPLSRKDVNTIVSIAESHGATAKVSSIHVNIWYGQFDKLTMTLKMCGELFDENEDDIRTRYVYVGDSPNDVPMFEFFPLSVGVANVLDFGDQLRVPPKYVTKQRYGAGFVELAQRLIESG